MTQDLLRLPVVVARTGWSRSTLYAKIKAGEFPPPISLGKRSVAWASSDIDAWIDNRIKQGWRTSQKQDQFEGTRSLIDRTA